jgi:hypothetical protein
MFHQGPGVPSSGAAGLFFACRTTEEKGNRRWWRYVDADGTVIATDADMLRRINPGGASRVELTPGTVDLEQAWTAAAASIVEAHPPTW